MLRFARGRRGNVATVAALTAVPLMGFVGMATDWGAVHMAQTQLQMGTDAAAVAAVTALPDDVKARAIAKAYAASVNVQGTAIDVQDSDIDFGTWDGTTFTSTAAAVATVVKVTGHASVSMPITSLFGIGSIDLHAVAGGGGVAGGPAPDMVIVQDVTGSFAEEIDEAVEADLALVDCIHDRSDPSTKVGLIAFTGLETNLLSPDTLVPYDTHYNAVRDEIEAIDSCGNAGMPACSGTNIASGLYMAQSILAASTTDPELGRAVVLVSDGQPSANNTVCAKVGGVYKSPSAEAFCPGWSNAPTTTKLENAALALRDQLETAGYDLYTVFYNEGSNAAASAFMEDLTAGEGIYLETPNAASLTPLLNKICKQYAFSNPGLVF